MTRLTPERLAEIRHAINSSWGVTISEQLILLRELDAVTKERDEARKERDDLHRCGSTWQGHRCRYENGHQGIHASTKDESDWIDGDGPWVSV